MNLTRSQKTFAIIISARLLSYVAVGCFALSVTAALGWKRLVQHQLGVGLTGTVLFFWLSLQALKYLPVGQKAESPISAEAKTRQHDRG